MSLIKTYVESAKELTTENDLVNLIKEVVEHPQIFVFGELLDVPIIQELRKTASPWVNLLELFAYGKFFDYDQNLMAPLTDQMVKKLRLLTIVTLGTNRSKKIPYSVLGEELKMNNIRDLEDLIIEAIYSNLIKGKLDQKSICLEIEWTLARDVRTDKFDDITNVLENWITNCESILANIDRQAKVANSVKANNTDKRLKLESYISQVKKTIKITNDERMMEDMWEINSLQQQQEFEKYEKGKRGSAGGLKKYPTKGKRF